MRIALNIEQLFYHAPGGTGRYTARLAAALADGGDEVVSFCAWHGRDRLARVMTEAGLADAGLALPARLPLPRPVLVDVWHRLRVGSPRRLSRAVAGAAVVHSPSVAVPPVSGVPLVVTVHDAAYARFPDTYPRRGRRFHRQAVAAAARHADLVLTVSRAAADEIAAWTPIPADRLRVVPNGVDQTRAAPAEVGAVLAAHRIADRPYVLWVGSLEPRKDVGTLVAAFRRLGTDTHRLVLAGGRGWLEHDLVDPADAAALGDRLRPLGRVGDDALRALYAGADLFALPSRHEGFGLPLLEAMVQGTAVVCSDLPATREVAGDHARFVPAGDVEAWTAALAQLLDDPAGRRALAAGGPAHAAGFTWARTAAATRAVYAELVG